MTSKTFCHVAFRELYFESTTGKKYSSCCQQYTRGSGNVFSDETFSFEKDEWLQNLRQQLVDGEQPSTCVRCWDLEQKGFESFRQRWNKHYDAYVPNDSSPVLEVLDVRLSNKCNLQCKMCNMEFSDQIAKNYIAAKAAGIDVNKNDEHLAHFNDYGNNNAVDGLLEFILKNPTIKTIKLAGGEPMIMDEIEHLLTELVRAGRTNLKIFCLTNATTVKTRFIKILEQFASVELSCSIDGVGKWIEYQRFPAQWKTIKRNYRKLTDSKLQITLTPVWTQLNLLGIIDYFKWLEDEQVDWLSFSEVIDPSYLSWELVPMKYREEVIDQLDSIKFPKHVHSNYFNFVERIKTSVREITPNERVLLDRNVKIWDFNNKYRYVDVYPWGKELLGEE